MRDYKKAVVIISLVIGLLCLAYVVQIDASQTNVSLGAPLRLAFLP